MVLARRELLQQGKLQASADADHAVHLWLFAYEHAGLSRLYADHVAVGVLLLEVPPHSVDRAARASPADEAVHLPVGLLPDLWTSVLVVRERVVVRFELIWCLCLKESDFRLLEHTHVSIHGRQT